MRVQIALFWASSSAPTPRPSMLQSLVGSPSIRWHPARNYSLSYLTCIIVTKRPSPRAIPFVPGVPAQVQSRFRVALTTQPCRPRSPRCLQQSRLALGAAESKRSSEPCARAASSIRRRFLAQLRILGKVRNVRAANITGSSQPRFRENCSQPAWSPFDARSTIWQEETTVVCLCVCATPGLRQPHESFDSILDYR